MKTVRMIKLRLIFLDRTIVCTARPSRSLGRHGLVSGSATNVRDTVCRRLDLPLTSPQRDAAQLQHDFHSTQVRTAGRCTMHPTKGTL